MARVKIHVPDIQFTSIPLQVRITDINYGNHLANNALVGLLHEARMQWLKSGGFSELDGNGGGLIMADLAVEYKQQLFWADNVDCLTGADVTSAKSFDMYYKLISQNKVAALAKTGMVYFDYQLGKVANIPADFAAFLKG